jgi:hypothetical protein
VRRSRLANNSESEKPSPPLCFRMYHQPLSRVIKLNHSFFHRPKIGNGPFREVPQAPSNLQFISNMCRASL